MSEFGNVEVIVKKDDGHIVIGLNELLPRAFGPKSLELNNIKINKSS
jgi:cytidine deaminase